MRLLDKLHSGGVYTIAELSVNHAGSLDLALDAVRLAAKAGADCLKTQYFTGDSITLNSDSGPFRMEGQYHSLYEFYEAVKMPVEWQPRIKAECEKHGIDFLCTPTDAATADYLDELGFLENDAHRFQAAVLAALDGSTPVLAAVKPKDTDFLRRVRQHPHGEVFSIKPESREALYQHLRSRILQWNKEEL